VPYRRIHRSKCRGMGIMTSRMHKTGTMVAARVTDNSGDRGPRIGVGGGQTS